MADKRFLKGLFKDTGHIDQPEGSWRHARNMVINETEGAVSNEGGTFMSGYLGSTGPISGAGPGATHATGNPNDKVLGAIEVSADRVILFVVDSVSSTLPRSEIGIWEKNAPGAQSYTPLLNLLLDPFGASPGKLTNDLNFKTSKPIEGTFKVDPKGDLIVYWTDDLNPPRAFNIDRQLRESGHFTELYGVSSNTLDNIDLLNLFPYSGPVPHIDIDNQGDHQNCVIEGGGLLTGVYYLALAYVDDDLVATNFLTVSNPIPIVDEFDSTVPTNKKDGARAGSQTTKAIKWDISNLNVDYKYLRPIVIRSKGDAQEAFKLNDVIFTLTTTSIVYSGLETVSTGTPSEVIIDTIGYDTAKTIQQLDGILYLGNTTGSKDVGFQPYANNIKLKSRVDSIEDFDVFYASIDNLETGWGSKPVNSYGPASTVYDVDPTKSYRYVPNIFKNKGYMRDEIYAFYIAFIMKDGSMSYAYHIPGRVNRFREKNPVSGQAISYGDLWEDIANVSPTFGKLFHWADTYNDIISSGSYATNVGFHKHMNYWENATEFYPNTDNYDVRDKDGFVSNLQGLNVRHHHFPSNRNLDRKTIQNDKLCRTNFSAGSASGSPAWSGKMVMLNIDKGEKLQKLEPYSWSKLPFKHSPAQGEAQCPGQWGNAVAGGYDNDPAMQSALWNSTTRTFTADQEMEVRVRYKVVHRQTSITLGMSTDPDDIEARVMHNIGGVGATLWPGTLAVDTPQVEWKIGSLECGHAGHQTCGGGWQGWKFVGDNSITWSSWLTLNAGDTIWLESRKINSDGSSMYMTGCEYYNNECVTPWGYNYFEFEIKSALTAIPDKDLLDAKINHHVTRLGFDLEDIHIPKSIGDKVQGFRIYYANKKHSDRTVLGQGALIPALYKKDILGICAEGTGTNITAASQVLSTLQATPEEFYNMDAYARYWGDYPVLPFNEEAGGAVTAVQTGKNEPAMNTFSFHDFSLLRSKNSLAPATHIDILYYSRNLAWNGPGLDQDKKMVTTLTDPGGGDPLKVKEVWGWDSDQNCYPQKMKTAFFVGVEYQSSSNRTQPRLIGQKAKTYLLGDTIFKGTSLGFGGKLFNEFGESCIAFKLMDNHAIGAERVRSYPTTSTIGHFADIYGSGSTEAQEWGAYGRPHGGLATLVNRLDSTGAFKNGGTGGWHGQRSMSVIANLKAFKTDVYKSIDSQELVWTGFEVIGEDLEDYIFDEDTKVLGGTGNTIDTHPDGIYGGDTFICRYGANTTLKPSNAGQSAEPEKAVHYHIVESTDNLNFRHVEGDDSMYFPNTILKEMLRESGRKDFNHFDNLKYNHNYSEVNNIRPAFPLPLRDVIQDDFPTRAHRSAKNDTTSIIDNYRIFLANQFKDLPKNRGDLWKLSSFNNLLYFHMEQSLFAAQGKQTMSMGDGSEAFVGSGDIFAQEPNELVHTKGGFGGTQSQRAALTTRYGYFFVDRMSKKVFMMKDQLEEISNLGMEKWFQDNLGFFMESDFNMHSSCAIDNPIDGIGLHTIYDPKFKRVLLTKRDIAPTQAFIDGYNKPQSATPQGGTIRFHIPSCAFRIYFPCLVGAINCTPWTILKWDNPDYFTPIGWTISYYPELGFWGSFHDYVPYIYFNTSKTFYSLTDKYPRPCYFSLTTTPATHFGTTYGNTAIWEHNDSTTRGIIYQENTKNTLNAANYEAALNRYPFEFEFIHNEFKAEDTLTAAFGYTLETFNQAGISVLEHGFTSFFIYNTFQLSGVGQDWLDSTGTAQTDATGTTLTDANMTTLEYLVNTRRIGNNWKVNNFRDMSNIAVNQDPYYMLGTAANPNILGGANVGTVTTSSIDNMFIYDGMSKIVNASYLNLGKNWNLQKKFIDKWVGIRLIYDNISNNLLNLYSTNVAVRKSLR